MVEAEALEALPRAFGVEEDSVSMELEDPELACEPAATRGEEEGFDAVSLAPSVELPDFVTTALMPAEGEKTLVVLDEVASGNRLLLVFVRTALMPPEEGEKTSVSVAEDSTLPGKLWECVAGEEVLTGLGTSSFPEEAPVSAKETECLVLEVLVAFGLASLTFVCGLLKCDAGVLTVSTEASDCTAETTALI